MHQNLLRLAPILMMLCLLLGVRGTTGYVVLTPLQNYTVFENNASAVFYCSGYGSALVWILNESAYGPVHAQRGITFTLSGAQATVTSNLYIPASVTNNNTEVMCKVADGTFTNVQTSNSSNLTVQGPLDAPYNFSVAMSNTSFNLSWGAPFSIDVTGYPADIFNYTLCTNITIHGCKTIPSDPDCTFPRTCTSSVDFTDPSLNGTNKTIMDYGDPIVFIFFAMNGAGNGTMANFTYMYSSTKEAGSMTQTFPSPTDAAVTNVTSFTDFKTETSIAALVVGVTIGVTGAVVLIVFSIGIAIKCYILKRKARYPCLSPTDCKPTCTSESQLKSQNKVKSDTPCYTDVACLQVITIPAPNDEVQYSEVKAPHN